jgi:DNA-binding PadR family transcriptional regulator
VVRSFRSNPLALTVLCLLAERPMHPYEMAQTLRERAKQESIRLNFGSLYGVVKSLDRQGLIRVAETEREGRRPQRTIYELTEAGCLVMQDWLEELVAVPVKEYLQFEAALSLIGGLSPDTATELLQRRCAALDARLGEVDESLARCERMGLPRLFAIETEYQRALLQAELAFTRQLVADIESGRLDGLEEWRRWHAGDRSAFDAVTAEVAARAATDPGPDPTNRNRRRP